MEEKNGLVCPECGHSLHEVYAEANYGRVMLLDQCQFCGGVWFDKWEICFVTDSAIKGLHQVDIKSFESVVPLRKGKGLCPRCGEALKIFSDPALPKDALIERCPSCSGLWLNRGELGRYAAHRESRKPQRNGRPAGLETLRGLQKELKLDSLAVPTTAELALNEPDLPVNSREVAKDLAFLALQALLRLVFKF